MVRLVNLLVKTALGVLLVVVAVGHNWPQLQGKAVGLRLLLYPIGGLLVPLVWWWRGHRSAYPHDVDALLAAPFAIDLAGNVFDLFDAVTWWDDINHLLNWALLCAGGARLLRRTTLPFAARLGLAVGFGATAAILWEAGEYLAFVRHSTEQFTAYRDTIGDEVLGLTGSILGGWLAGRR